jgi:hypothetical protein
MLAGLSLALAICGCGKSGASVASVQITTSDATPRVGQTAQVTAVPLDSRGVEVVGVACTYSSDDSAAATVDASSGLVTAIAVGVANISGRCAGMGASIAITVQPAEVALTLSKLGTGTGGLFTTPTGDPGFAPGSTVVITATANAGSTMTAWGGACVGTDASEPCTLVLEADTAASATFMLSETFVSATYNAPMSSVTDSIGCEYSVSASGIVTFNLSESGGLSGAATTTAHLDIVNTFTPPNDTCNALPFDAPMVGDISGSDASLAAHLATPHGLGTFVYSGVRSGTTITGTATVSYSLVDAAGNRYPSSGSTGSFTATEQQ